MRVSIVGSGKVEEHPPSRALGRRLEVAGNRVRVAGGSARRQVRPPDLVYPATRGDVPLAEAAASSRTALVAPPTWGLDPASDLAWRAPADAKWSSSPAGRGLPVHMEVPDPWQRPADRRHEGRRLGVCYRKTSTSPGRYLVSALRRAGVEVVELDRLAWAEHDGLDAVVVVESPLPPFVVQGDGPMVPVLFWVHHGEHHTAMQLRLLRRYRANAVLMAHSWHLAHQFPVPVHRFPFGVPMELVDGHRSWDERRWDVAFVGSGIEGLGAYRDRGVALGRLADSLGERFVARTGVPPEEMADLYGHARVVPNEGGTRHRPITMRVFEAIGSGALLVTEAVPGLDRLFDPAEDVVLAADDLADAALEALSDPGSSRRAAHGLERALGAHTTDHRVDELFAVLDGMDRSISPPTSVRPADPALAAVWDDPLLDDVIVLGTDAAEEQLPELVVWPEGRLDRYDGRSLAHAVVVGRTWGHDVDLAVQAARRVVVAADDREDIRAAVFRHHLDATEVHHPGVVLYDLGIPGYRVAA